VEFTFEEMTSSIVGLKSHKTLSSFKCSLEEYAFGDRVAEFRSLQEAFGEHIKVTDIPHFSFWH
jgi:hypothetical protein